MRSLPIYFVLITAFLLFSSCGTTDSQQEDAIYPMYVDENSNGINDYVEQLTHEAGSIPNSNRNDATLMKGQHFGERGHDFIDQDSDGICDYAQNGSPTWHGPGFVDDNNNGICDYWDSSHAMHRSHEGMRFHDENNNQVNDYFESETHRGPGHNFKDEDADGICDYAQDGSPTWHGPGFTDANQNGTCDYWEEGGRGHGRGHGMGGGHH